MWRTLVILSAFFAILASPSLVRADGEGQADLDQAVEKQLNLGPGSTPADLDEVVKLCESALKKGLDDASAQLANQVLSAAALQRAELITRQISPQGLNRLNALRRRAMQFLEKAVKANPKSGDAHLLIARLQSLPEGDTERAMQAADAAVESLQDDKPKLAAALILRSNMHEDKQKALADLEAATQADPGNDLAFQAKARAYLQEGDLEKAADTFRELLTQDEDNVLGRLALAETLADLRKYDDATAEVQRVLEKEPESATAHTLLGRIYAAQEKYPEAEKALTKAISLDARQLAPILLRAEVRLIQDKLVEAREDAERVLSVRPDLILGIMLRSRISALEEKYAEAIADMDLLLENDPGQRGLQDAIGLVPFA